MFFSVGRHARAYKEKTITDALQIDRQYKFIEKHKHMKKIKTMVFVSEHRNGGEHTQCSNLDCCDGSVGQIIFDHIHYKHIQMAAYTHLFITLWFAWKKLIYS